MRTLVADDDVCSRMLLQKVLTAWGYDVVTASGGEEAWRVLTGDSAPSLAVLDWMMPELDGVEVCRRIRALDLLSPPYLILLTSRNDKSDIATGLEAGAADYLPKPFDPDELRARLLVGRRFVELNHKLLETQEELRRQALTDPLTLTMNRRAVLALLSKEIARAAQQQLPLGIGILDIDHFKSINDRYGHAAGDFVLQAVVERIGKVLRPHDALGRIGGDEFLVVMPGVGPLEARTVLERIRRVVGATPFAVQGAELKVTVSIGGTVATADTADDLMCRVDRVLYRAKGSGRDRIVMARAKSRDLGARQLGFRVGPEQAH